MGSAVDIMSHGPIRAHTLLNAVAVTGAGSTVNAPCNPYRTFQLTGTTTAGAGAATVKVQVSNDNVVWIDLGTISLTLATTASADAFKDVGAWVYVRGNVTSISGTGAAVTLMMGA